MNVVFSNRAYLAVLTETYEKIKVETGGVFLGYYDDGTWYIIETLDPGPNSVFQVAYFEYDQKYTSHLINKIARLYKHQLSLVGLWHRHPGSFDEFSRTDDGTNSDYAKLSPNGAISLLVNVDPEFRLTAYHVDSPLRYTKITYQVGDDLIPPHLLEIKTHGEALKQINSYADRTRNTSVTQPKVSLSSLLMGVQAQFTSLGDELPLEDLMSDDVDNYRDFLLDAVMDDIDYLTDKRELSINVAFNNPFLCLSVQSVKVYFCYDTNKQQMVFSWDDNKYLYKSGLFTSLMADYVPAEASFKAGFKRMLGLVKEN